MLTQHIALVPEGNGVNASDLARVSAALQKQVVRDLAPMWGVAATVDAFPNLEDVPVGYWPIVVTFRQLGREAGVRVDRNGQPFAQVELCASWSLQASRACLEMLVNPSGNRSVTTASPRADQGPVELLLEPCASCEDPRHAYVINDVLVADFCTPAFYGAGLGLGHVRYTFTAAASAPFELLPGGHLTWYDPVSDSWWLRTHSDEGPVDTKLGSVEGSLSSVRELAVARAPRRLGSGGLSIEAFEARTGVSRQHALQASQYRAHRLRAQLSAGPAQPQATVDRVHMRSRQLTQAPSRQRAADHFDLLVELLQDGRGVESIEVDAHEDDDTNDARDLREASATPASRSNPPPLPANASSVKPPASAAKASAPGEQAPPASRARSLVLVASLVAAACLVLGWGARALLSGTAPTPRASVGTSARMRAATPHVPAAETTTTISAATAAPPTAAATVSAAPVAPAVASVPSAPSALVAASHHRARARADRGAAESGPTPSPSPSQARPAASSRGASLDELIDSRR